MSTAAFVERVHCIGCRSKGLQELSSGSFDEGPLQDFIANDPWGENPAPYLIGHRWSFVQCRDCGQAFHRRILSPEWNEIRFSQWMSQEAIEQFEKPLKTPELRFQKGRTNTGHVIRLEMLTKNLHNKEAVRVLDFGCGYGEFLAMCSLYGFEAYGVDRSAARRNNNQSSSIFAELDDLETSDVASRQFHAITLFEVLEHLDDPRIVLESLAKLLVVGGVLVLETPDCSGVTNIVTRNDYLRIHPLEHINAFTPQTLRTFAERLGFAQIRTPQVHVTGDPLRAAKTEMKRVVGGLLRPTTQQCFRKL